MSRLPHLASSDLDGEQKKLFEEMNTFGSEAFKDKFVYKGADGSLLGPFCPLLQTVDVARAFFSSLKSIGKLPGLPISSREIAILAVGSKWKASYEIYSHERIAILDTGLTQQQIDMAKAGRKPDGLDNQEETAFDVTMELMNQMAPLSEAMWQQAVKAFGKIGALALVHYVGFFSYLCVLCNGCDVSLPEGEFIK